MPKETILLLAANPKEATPLRLDDELSEIRRSLRGAKLREQFRLEVVTSARQKDVRRALLDHKPSVVHFSGHGTDDAEILIVKDDGSPHFVGAEALAPFFEIFRDHVRCVVLNSCYSQRLAERIGRHVDYVVGMKDAVKDEVAIQYAVAFYDALFAGETMERAHRLGCNAIRFAGLPGHLQPALHVAEGASSSPPIGGKAQVRPNDLLSEISRLYFRRQSAVTLLSKIGFPHNRMPLFEPSNAAQFWAEVRDMLDDGVVEGAGLDSLRQEALSDFPGNEILKRPLGT